MNILYFHQHFVTPKGAGGIRSYAMACALIERGHNVIMVCGNVLGGKSGLNGEFKRGVRRGWVDGIDVIEFDLKYSNNHGNMRRTLTFLRFAFRSLILVFMEQYDIIFATSTPLTASIPGIFARWLRKKPFVFEVRDLWPALPRAMGVIKNPLMLSAISLLEWVSYKSAHRLIGLSPGIVEGIERRGIPRNQIALIPNGCDLDIFPSSEISRPKEIPPSDFLAIFSGAHGIANGLDELLDVAVELNKRGRKDIKLLLIGEGKLKKKLQLRVRREKLECVLFKSPLNKTDLSSLMTSANLGLQCLANVSEFYYGTSPNKFFDYIATGLPVLTNYPGWISDLINKYECGFSVEPNNPSAFADALECAADNRLALKLKSINARDLAVNIFDRKLLSSQWVDWILDVKVN
jgi:glycosyltransferase involved in cell wall biosynthesis